MIFDNCRGAKVNPQTPSFILALTDHDQLLTIALELSIGSRSPLVQLRIPIFRALDRPRSASINSLSTPARNFPGPQSTPRRFWEIQRKIELLGFVLKGPGRFLEVVSGGPEPLGDPFGIILADPGELRSRLGGNGLPSAQGG